MRQSWPMVSFTYRMWKVSGLLQGIHDFTVSLLGSNHLANIACPVLDCEQSLFFFRFSEGSARASIEWQSRKERGRQPKKKKHRLLTQLEQMKYTLASQCKYDWLMREALTTKLSIIKTINKLMTAEALQNLCHGFQK